MNTEKKKIKKKKKEFYINLFLLLVFSGLDLFLLREYLKSCEKERKNHKDFLEELSKEKNEEINRRYELSSIESEIKKLRKENKVLIKLINIKK